MNSKIFRAALAVYVVAAVVTAITPANKRIYWPLYLPIAAAVAFLLAGRSKS